MTDKEVLANIMKATGLNTMQFSREMGFKRAEKLYRVLFAQVYGDSMAPDYNAGETIACRQVTNLDILPYGEAYYIELKESANGLKVIKLLFPGSNPAILIARSKNPNFPGDMMIPKNDISRLFLIKGKMTRNIV